MHAEPLFISHVPLLVIYPRILSELKSGAGTTVIIMHCLPIMSLTTGCYDAHEAVVLSRPFLADRRLETHLQTWEPDTQTPTRNLHALHAGDGVAFTPA